MSDARNEIREMISSVSSKISISKLNPGDRYYLSLHPYRSFAWYVGCSLSGTLSVILETPFVTKQGFQMQTKSILCYSEIVESYSSYRLNFDLQKQDDLPLFSNMMEDIILSSLSSREETVAVDAIGRFSMWKNMLKSGGIQREKYKGFLGELIVFLWLMKKYPVNMIIGSWIGPEAKEKDFSFPDVWIEVKTISANRLDVPISSLQQLDSPMVGFLVVCKVSEVNSDGLTCASLFEEICNRLKTSELIDFRNKIEELGFMPVVLNPIQYRYEIVSKDIFAVRDFQGKKFPRLITDMGHPAIKNVGYTITLAALEEWRVEDV